MEASRSCFRGYSRHAFGEDQYSDFIRRAPIHELESIFWVLCWLCLFREAPGSHQAGPKDPGAIPDECRLIFDEDILDMGYIKRDTMQHRGIFDARVLENVAPFLEPLKPTLLELFWVLHNGYEDRAERGPQVAALSDLHQQFMDIFEKAEAALTMSLPEESDFAKYCTSQLQRRREFDVTCDPIDYSRLKADTIDSRPGKDVTNLTSSIRLDR